MIHKQNIRWGHVDIDQHFQVAIRNEWARCCDSVEYRRDGKAGRMILCCFGVLNRRKQRLHGGFYVEVRCNVHAPPEDEEWTRCHSIWLSSTERFITNSYSTHCGRKKKREIEWDRVLFFLVLHLKCNQHNHHGQSVLVEFTWAHHLRKKQIAK